MKMVQLQGVCRLPKWMQGVIWLIYVTHIDVIDIYTNPYAIPRPIGWAPGTLLLVKFVIFEKCAHSMDFCQLLCCALIYVFLTTFDTFIHPYSSYGMWASTWKL